MAQALAKARTIRKAEQFFSGAGAGQKASLEALLFRPVQRMCLYPLLFRRPPQIPSQTPPLRFGWLRRAYCAPRPPSFVHSGRLSARASNSTRRKSSPVADRSARSSPISSAKSSNVYRRRSLRRGQRDAPRSHGKIARSDHAPISRHTFLIWQVNEDVRERENRMLTHATLSGEVADFHKLIAAARTLVHTCHVDMKARRGLTHSTYSAYLPTDL